MDLCPGDEAADFLFGWLQFVKAWVFCGGSFGPLSTCKWTSDGQEAKKTCSVLLVIGTLAFFAERSFNLFVIMAELVFGAL